MIKKGEEVDVVDRINSALHLAICFVAGVAFRIFLILVLVAIYVVGIVLGLAPCVLAILAIFWLWNHW